MKPPPPRFPARRIGHGHGEAGRDRRVDGIATPLQHIGADSRGDFFLRDDHAMLGDYGMNRSGGRGRVRAAALFLRVSGRGNMR